MAQVDTNSINASPTKEFFISMLVKDIGLTRAILDLVDNSVDGAKRLKSNGSYDGLWARLELDETSFVIKDNCGGMTIPLARDFAFRFGRAADTPTTKHAVGQFGVGMKRALFKLGRTFSIVSATTTSRFMVEVDVDKWKTKDESPWSFEFKTKQEGIRVPASDVGTTVVVTRLHEGVAGDFRDSTFLSRLMKELREAHTEQLNRGMVVTLNGMPITVQPLELLESSELKPALRDVKLKSDSSAPVKVRLYAGVGESSPSAAGWYVFCNGRMVLSADQTYTTGWGEGSESAIPKYHNQYAMFRGFAFFDSEDTGSLPWNTTKTGVDSDSRVYRAVRLEMVSMMRPVIDFLNRLSDEKKEGGGQGPLTKAVARASSKRMSAVKGSSVFKAPPVRIQRAQPRHQVIQYKVPVDKATKAKSALKAGSWKEVGERTFEYYYDREC